MRGPVIEHGERVSLRIVTKEDLPFIWATINDRDIVRYLRNPSAIFFFEGEEEWYISLSKKSETDRVFLVERNTDSERLGVIGLHSIDHLNGHAETGFFIAKEHWRNGYGSDALSLAVRHAAESLNLRKLYAWAYGVNAGSRRTLEKNGFVNTGALHSHMLVPGEGFADSLLFELMLDRKI